jgi:hypothetical protein
VDNVFYGQGYYGDHFYNSRALTVVHKNQLQAKDVHRAALGRDVIKNLGKIELKERSLTAQPFSGRNLSIEEVNGKKMIMRKGGESIEMKPATMPGRDIKQEEVSSATRTTAQSVERSGATSRGGEIRKKGDSAPPAVQTPPNPERIIRKKMDENSSQASASSRSASVMDRFDKYFSGKSSSSISRSSSGNSSSPRVSSPQSASPRSVSAPSSSRGSSSGGHSSPSRSGSVRKK